MRANSSANRHNEDCLAVDKAMVSAAVAARAWCERSCTPSDSSRPSLFVRLMRAATLINFVRIAEGEQKVLGVDDLVSEFSTAMSAWLPGGDDVVLIEDGLPTLTCEDLAHEAGADSDAEVEQGVVAKAMRRFVNLTSGAERYRSYRRYLIENAVVDENEALERFGVFGLNLWEHYEAIGPECLVSVGGEDHFVPCPRCGWPMRIRGERMACASDTCRVDGARFITQANGLLPRGARPAPCHVPARGRRRLRFGLWRYTLLPGLEELALEKALTRIDGVTVELWPHVDQFDLLVRSKTRMWRVDVKDHRSARFLAARFVDNPPPEPLVIVVPDRRRHQVSILRSRCGEIATLKFATASALLRRVREASR